MNALEFAATASSFTTVFHENPEKSTPAPEWYATASQRDGLARLHALADIFTGVGDDSLAGFHALVRSLVIGPTGCGKSTLARQFAKEKGWRFLAIDSGSWLPQGAITKPATLRIIRDHVRAPGHSVLFLDELCKLLPRSADASTSWALGCWSEFLALDGDTRLLTHEWTQEDIRRLRTSCFVIGGGAFTHALQEAKLCQKRGHLGFQDQAAPAGGYADKIRESLPEEVMSRFHTQPIILENPSCVELACAIERIHEHLDIPRTRPIKELLDQAQSTAGGLRWVDGYLVEILLEHPGRIPARQAVQPKGEKQDGFDFFAGDVVHHAREATEASFQLRAVLVRLQMELRARRNAISRSRRKDLQEYLYGQDGCRLAIYLTKAIEVANACTNVRADDSEVTDPILHWREECWEGMVRFPGELSRFGLSGLFTRSWDLSTRVAELRGHISYGVAVGRYGVQS